MTYQKSVKLSDAQKKTLNSLMTVPKNEYMALADLPKELLTVNFDNSITFALIIDSSNYVKDADNSLWVYAVLVKDGSQLAESDVDQNVYNTWSISYESDVYEVTIE